VKYPETPRRSPQLVRVVNLHNAKRVQDRRDADPSCAMRGAVIFADVVKFVATFEGTADELDAWWNAQEEARKRDMTFDERSYLNGLYFRKVLQKLLHRAEQEKEEKQWKNGTVERESRAARAEAVKLGSDERFTLQALTDALSRHGKPPPGELMLPHSIGLAVEWTYLLKSCSDLTPPGESADITETRLREVGTALKKRKIIGGRLVNGKYWVWKIRDTEERRAGVQDNATAMRA
jgi:hypothetical protein